MRNLYRTVHVALHDHRIKRITINNQILEIRKDTNHNVRYVQIGEITFREQEKKPNSLFGCKAYKGERITWAILPGKPWIYIDDVRIVDVS